MIRTIAVFFSESWMKMRDTKHVPYSWASKQEDRGESREIITVLYAKSWISDLKCSLITQHETINHRLPKYGCIIASFRTLDFEPLASWRRRYRYVRRTATKRRRKNGRLVPLSPLISFCLIQSSFSSYALSVLIDGYGKWFHRDEASRSCTFCGFRRGKRSDSGTVTQIPAARDVSFSIRSESPDYVELHFAEYCLFLRKLANNIR